MSILLYTEWYTANFALCSGDLVLLANGKEALRITWDDVGSYVSTDIRDLVLAKNDVITIVFDEEDTPYEPYSGVMYAPGGGAYGVTINIYDFNDNKLANIVYEGHSGTVTGPISIKEQSGFPLTLTEAVKIEFAFVVL